MTAQRRYELTDEEWERIKGYFPEREAGQKGRPRNEDRQSSTGYYGLFEAEPHGGTYRSDTELGALCTAALCNGRKKACSMQY